MRTTLCKIIILFILSAFLCCAGAEKEDQRLSEIARILDTHPRQALAALDSIDSSLLREEDYAFYALLKTQAEYKCYIFPQTDSLIRVATSFYGDKKRSLRAAMSWYSLGCVYSEWEDDAQAVEAYLKAKPLFPDTLNRYYVLCNQNLGIHFLNRRMYTQSLQALAECRRGAQQIKDSATVAFADYHSALNYLYRSDYAEAERLLQRVLGNPKASALTNNTIYLQLAKIELYKNKDCTKARYYLHLNEIGTRDSTTLGANYSLRGDICCELQQPDSAYYWYRRSLSCQSELFTDCWNYHQLSELAPVLGLTDSVPSYVSRYTLLADSIREVERQSELSAAYSQHQIEEHRKAISRKTARIVLTVVALTVLSALLLGFGLLLRDRNRKNQYLKLQEELRQSRRQSLSIPEEDVSELRRRKLDICCRIFRNTPSARLLFGHSASNASLSASERATILKDVNDSFVDIMLDVKNEVPQVSEQELMLCAFNALHCPPQIVADCLILSPTTLRTRKYRLKEKLPKELFELFFEDNSSETNN
ncbi:MAG: hypothetical protein J5814_07845 [Bacteroidaceae bacterium]|nr:hypothetical protein [Bacteroidaceae bacterium]